MSRIWFFRHGQAGLRQNYDALSDLGYRQARRLGEYLASEQIEFRAVFSGELVRQRETARAAREAFAAMHEPLTDANWNEFDLTRVYDELAPILSEADPRFRAENEALMRMAADQGSPVHRQWTHCDTVVMRAWMEERYDCHAESWTMFQQRVLRSLDQLRAFDPRDNIAVFTSATPIAIWMGMALGVADGHLMRLAGAMYNTAITSMRIRDGVVSLFSFNGVPHLPAGLRTFR